MSNTPLAYFNGHTVPQDELRIRPQDTGFMLGVTVAEQLRTFRGELFAWNAHADRLHRSLKILKIDVDLDAIAQALVGLVAHNHGLLESGGDLGVTIFVTPGVYPTYAEATDLGPTVGMHTYPLPFGQWAAKYQDGQHCQLVTIPQVSDACWPRELKCRSRAHYYLADQAARETDPHARAILLDRGVVNEASTANVLLFHREEGLVSPRLETILPGVSLRFLESLAEQQGIPFTYRDVEPDELSRASEVMLSSTPFCLLPVSRVDGHALPDRECFDQLLAAWSQHVGLDIAQQAFRCSR